jgi:hypothetical protein
VTDAWWADDDNLLAAVKVALESTEEVPARFIQTARASFAWHDIDAELAALTYDSASDLLAGTSTRADPAALRNLTFEASELSIELEVIGDVLHGQLVPPQAGSVEIRLTDGASATTPVNEVGYFTASAPAGPFRLHCSAGDVVVQTEWITL